MQYEVEVGGRRLPIVVTRSGDGFSVSVDGRMWQVDAARIDAHTLSLVADTASSYEVSVAADPVSGQLAVHVGATPVAVTLNGRRRWGRKDDAAGTGSGPQRLLAPMPGKVVRVLVKAGDPVVARQPVVVVEAMKMENELRAPRAGAIKDVRCAEGAAVESGQELITIEPDPVA